MSGLSEAALHVQAMRFVCKALADREQQAIEVDWDVLRHMLNVLETIFQGIENQRDDDRDELMHTRKDRDHWRQARQEAHEAGELMRAELETLRGAMAADDKRLRDAEQRIWPGLTWGCDAPDKMADAILHLRQQLAEQQAETFDVRRQRNNETDRLNATNAVSLQQRDEIAYLRRRLGEERSVSAGLRQQLNAAQAAVTLQRAGIERLAVFVWKVREAVKLRSDAGFVPALERVIEVLAELDETPEPTPLAEQVPCPECERLRAFVQKARQAIGRTMNFCDVEFLLNALAELDAEGGQ